MNDLLSDWFLISCDLNIQKRQISTKKIIPFHSIRHYITLYEDIEKYFKKKEVIESPQGFFRDIKNLTFFKFIFYILCENLHFMEYSD